MNQYSLLRGLPQNNHSSCLSFRSLRLPARFLRCGSSYIVLLCACCRLENEQKSCANIGRLFFSSSLIILFLLPLGCVQQSTDPREGGLFNYNPNAYEQRLKERRQTLGESQQEQDVTEMQNLSLERGAAAMREENAAILQDIDAMNSELDRIEQAMIEQAGQLKAHQEEKERVNKEITAIRKQLNDLPEQAEGDVAAQEQQTLRLRERLKTLMAEAKALMNL